MQVIYLHLLLYTNKKFLCGFKINKIIETDYHVVHPVCI